MVAPVIPVILSGGQGVRLWPLSRTTKPKQFIPLVSGRSLFEQTLLRVGGKSGFAEPLIICSKDHRFLVRTVISNKYKVQKIIAEPCGRNTAPALCAAAFYAQENYKDDDPLLLVLPSDHYIDDTANFLSDVARAVPLAQDGYIVTFGIAPRYAHTGFGYIERGAATGEGYCVEKFHEKPDMAQAADYLEQGGFYWNSGIYLVKASVYLAEVERQCSDVLVATSRAYTQSREDMGDLVLSEEFFPLAPDVSIDRAVMEETDKGCVVPASFHWDDLGSWDALWDVSQKNADCNALQGDVVAIDTRNSYLRSDSMLLCTVGVDNVIAVVEQGAVFVGAREDSEKIRELIAQLKDKGRPELVHAQEVYCPWGYYKIVAEEISSRVRRIHIDPGCALPAQTHKYAHDNWVIVQGNGYIVVDGVESILAAGQSVHLPAGIAHHIGNRGDSVLEIIEVQTLSSLAEE